MSFTVDRYRVDTPDLEAAWIELLNRPAWEWSWWVTLTYKQQVKPEAAERDFKRWIRDLNTNRFGPRYGARGKGLNWARTEEYQLRGVLHYHALVGLTGHLDRWQAKSDWEKIGAPEWFQNANKEWERQPRTGYARIYEYDRTQGAISYVSKYVAKSGQITVGYDRDTGSGLRLTPMAAETLTLTVANAAPVRRPGPREPVGSRLGNRYVDRSLTAQKIDRWFHDAARR